MIEQTIAKISSHELEHGTPPPWLKMKEGPFIQLVLEMCLEQGLSRQITRKRCRDCSEVRVLHVKIIREGSDKLPECVRVVKRQDV